MYRNSYQRGMLTIFFSVGSKPLEIWETHIKNGYVQRFLDQDIKSMVLEIGGTNVSTTYITCPKGNQVLGITMPFLVMIVKNLKKYFSFEVTILDDTGTRRRFRVSNFQSTTQILPLCTVMPIGLSDEWNQIQFNLAEFTRRAYNKKFVEVQKLKINANIRLRRVYFTETLVPTEQLPPEYRLYFPVQQKKGPQSMKQGEPIKPSVSQQSIEFKKNVPDVKKSDSKILTTVKSSEKNVNENIELETPQPSQAKVVDAAPSKTSLTADKSGSKARTSMDATGSKTSITMDAAGSKTTSVNVLDTIADVVQEIVENSVPNVEEEKVQRGEEQQTTE